MFKPDETDLRILAELDMDADASYTDIAKKLSLSYPTVQSRISTLEEIKVIKHFAAQIDFFKLRYSSHLIHLRLQYANQATKKEIMDYLQSSPYVRWCRYGEGKFDISFSCWHKKNVQLFSFWDAFKKAFNQYIKEVVVTPYTGAIRTTLPFTKEIHGQTEAKIIGDSGTTANIDNIDKSILRILSTDGRASLISIGKAVELTSAAVKYRIDQLVKKKVILGFRPLIDMEMLGYTTYRVGFNLDSLVELEKIQQNLLGKKSIPYITKSMGGPDVEIYMYAKSLKELDSNLHEIEDELSDNLRDYDVHTSPRTEKEVFMPEF